MKKLWVLAIILAFSFNVEAQEEPRTITVTMTAQELLPADLIVFNINVNAEERTPREAFNKHKELEHILADALKDFDIVEDDIRFQPISINKRYRNYPNDEFAETQQRVSITFSDFSIYEEIQLTLIENGFDSFNGNFSSSDVENGKENALEVAIKSAYEKAEIIADASDVKLGEVISVSHSDHTVSRHMPLMEADASMFRSAGSSMMDFGQTVTISATVTVVFEIDD